MHAFLMFLPIDPLWIGMEFTKSPLHCTLMPWFWVREDASEMVDILRPICERYEPFTLIAGEPALFGPKHDVPVHVLEQNEDLLNLHVEILTVLDENFARHIEPRYAGPDYRMHVTTQKGRAFATGSKITALAAYLIEAPADDLSRKKVVAELPFA